MSDLYNKTGERLWEKLEYYRDSFQNINCVDFKESFPIDQFSKHNKLVLNLIKEVEQEYNYEMSEFQCSWAIVQFIKGGLKMMKEYNQKNNTNLMVRK